MEIHFSMGSTHSVVAGRDLTSNSTLTKTATAINCDIRPGEINLLVLIHRVEEARVGVVIFFCGSYCFPLDNA